jgi:feruloyl esterase
MMAQRYPTQYNGVLATASAFNWDKFVTSEYWPQVVMHKLGKNIFSKTQDNTNVV